ncbi:MAG: hypothetical protein ACK5JF_14215, partial [Oscillospiraceae bacterium]
MKKIYGAVAVLLCLLLLVGCGGGQVRMGSEVEPSSSGAVQTSQVSGEYAGYDQTRVETSPPLPIAPQEEEVQVLLDWQVLMPTREAAELSYMISRPYLFGAYPKYFSDFKGMQTATPVQIMEMGSTIAPTINVHFSWETDLEKYENHVLKKIWDDLQQEDLQTTEDGTHSVEFFYASDMESALVDTFGEYPVEGKKYTDNFETNKEAGFYYYPSVDIIVRDMGDLIVFGYVERGFPVVTSLEKQGENTVVEVVRLMGSDAGDSFADFSIYDSAAGQYVDLTAENFEETTKGYEKYRYTFTKAADDGRWIIVSAEKTRNRVE